MGREATEVMTGKEWERRGEGLEETRRQVGEVRERLLKLCAQMPRTIEDLQQEIGCGRSEIYRHVAKAIEFGLLERNDQLRNLPALLLATGEGHEFARSGLVPQRISPGAFQHFVACSQVTAQLRARYPNARLISDAELRRRELDEDHAIASAEIGYLPSGRARLHRPDLVLAPEGQMPTAIEVELTPKAPERLRAIVRAWRETECIRQVIYLCSDEALGAVERASRQLHFGREKVLIRRLERVG